MVKTMAENTEPIRLADEPSPSGVKIKNKKYLWAAAVVIGFGLFFAIYSLFLSTMLHSYSLYGCNQSDTKLVESSMPAFSYAFNPGNWEGVQGYMVGLCSSIQVNLTP